jgi:hypothetical protein
MALDPNSLQGMFGSGGLMDAMTYNKLKQMQATQEQMGQPSETQRKLAALGNENALLRRELTALQTDVQAMLEADARRHKREDDESVRQHDIAQMAINMFEAFETAIRDLATVQAGIPAESAAYGHPAANSMYHQLNIIHAALARLRLLMPIRL